MTVPAGFAGPLPVGISFMGARWSDGRMLALAADFSRVAAGPGPAAVLADPAVVRALNTL